MTSSTLTRKGDHGGEVQLHVRVDGPDVGSLLQPIPSHKQINVEIEHVCAAVPNLFNQPSTWSKLTSKFSSSKKELVDGGKYRQILFDVSGSVRPGEVLALMGPSGSGKTTLLSILGARQQKHMKVEGRVTFNGQKLSKRLKRQIGYVMQDDLLYESLTVYEVLYYAAMLRLPSTMTVADKRHRVDTVIKALGLDTCRDTIIGGFFRKGISGGERKRTSCGHELLINPSLLFLDEPTSGLDSTTAMHLLGVLRQLAVGGRAVITTIHQPSSRLYQQLDKLLLLSQGHVMYYGQAAHAVEFFGDLGAQLPFGVNVADFILDLASGDVEVGDRDGEATRQFLVDSSEAYLKGHAIDGYRSFKGGGADTSSLPHSYAAAGTGGQVGPPSPATPPAWDSGRGAGGGGPASPAFAYQSSMAASESAVEEGQSWAIAAGQGVKGQPGGLLPSNKAYQQQQQQERERDSSGTEEEEEGSASDDEEAGLDMTEPRWGAPFHQQVAILFRRSIRTRRFETFSKQDIFQYITIAVLAGLFWLQKANKDTLLAARNTLGLLFFELMFLSIRALFVALFTFPEEHKMMLKERASGMYRLSAFYIARTASDLPMDFAIPTVFMIIVYFMGGLRYNAGAFFGNYGINILAMLVAQGIGLLLGAVIIVPKSAQTIASVIMLTMVLTGGFFVAQLPNWIGWLKYLSYIYYALGVLLYIEFDGGNRAIYRCMDASPGADVCTLTDPSSPEGRPDCAPVDDLQSALGLVQDPSSRGQAIRDAFILLGFMIFFRIVIYFALRRKTRGF